MTDFPESRLPAKGEPSGEICLFVVMRTVVVYLNNNLVLKANVVGPTPVS